MLSHKLHGRAKLSKRSTSSKLLHLSTLPSPAPINIPKAFNKYREKKSKRSRALSLSLSPCRYPRRGGGEKARTQVCKQARARARSPVQCSGDAQVSSDAPARQIERESIAALLASTRPTHTAPAIPGCAQCRAGFRRGGRFALIATTAPPSLMLFSPRRAIPLADRRKLRAAAQ